MAGLAFEQYSDRARSLSDSLHTFCQLQLLKESAPQYFPTLYRRYVLKSDGFHFFNSLYLQARRKLVISGRISFFRIEMPT